MRILYLCHRIPYPPDKGDKIRSWHEVEWLARRHEVDLFTLVDDPADVRHVRTLAEHVRHVTAVRLRPRSARLLSLRALATGEPLSVVYFRRRPLVDAVRTALARERYDVLVAFSSEMAPYLDGATAPLVADFVDLDSAKWSAYAARVGGTLLKRLYRREGEMMRALEKRIAERAAATILCAQTEERELRTFASPRHAVTIPNGTDTAYFTPDLTASVDPLVVFTGAMDYRANADAVIGFVAEDWPAIRAARPDATFRIVGSNPLPEVRALATRPGVEVTGRVPDVRPHLRAAGVAVAPLEVARGIQNKVLEALACGTPVVASRQALSGIGETTPGVVVAERGRFGAAVVGLLADRPLRDRLGREGRAHVVDEWRWERRLETFEQLLTDVAGGQAAMNAP